MENGKMIVDGVYLHINNGGVTFSVTNEDGLALEIEAGHFGNITNKMKLFLKKNSLRKLGEMLIDASEREGQKIEWLSLDCRAIDKDTGKTKCFNPNDESRDFSFQQHSGVAAAGTTASTFTKEEIEKLLQFTVENETNIYTDESGIKRYKDKMHSGFFNEVGHHLVLTVEQYDELIRNKIN